MTHNLYHIRFTKDEIAGKQRIWKVICEDFLQRFVDESSIVLDLGCGFCEFINNIKCEEKYAIDLNANCLRCADATVKTFCQSATDLSNFRDSFFDVVFASNLFEHLKSKEHVKKTLYAIKRVLKEGGSLLILQPNFKYCYKDYWNFYDHNIPFTHLSMCEVLSLVGFNIQHVIPRFLPYTTKSRLPKAQILVKLYLRIPLLWKIFGGQMFIVAKKPKRRECAKKDPNKKGS